tara:strand:- start:672 stop:824 length:153 start_codon:yes stop_codon:yes gene_type:complete
MKYTLIAAVVAVAALALVSADPNGDLLKATPGFKGQVESLAFEQSFNYSV